MQALINLGIVLLLIPIMVLVVMGVLLEAVVRRTISFLSFLILIIVLVVMGVALIITQTLSQFGTSRRRKD